MRGILTGLFLFILLSACEEIPAPVNASLWLDIWSSISWRVFSSF